MTAPDTSTNASGKQKLFTVKPICADGARNATELPIEIHVVHYGSYAYSQALELRRHVLREPLGLEFTPEELLCDEDDVHIGCWNQGILVGCLTLSRLDNNNFGHHFDDHLDNQLDNNHWKVRQVAVRTEVQRSGIGSRLMDFAESTVRKAGGSVIEMHARDSAVEFYRRLGYVAQGDYFVEVTVPHVVMKKVLDLESLPSE